MWNRLPRPREFAVLFAMAVVCTVILAITKEYHAGLAILSGPVFIVSAVMGLNRHAALNKASAHQEPAEAGDPDRSGK
jgi:hypothetical protein